MKYTLLDSFLLRILFLLCLFSIHTLGNGGGYHYGVKFTGSIAPFTAKGTENVQILEEKLDIGLRKDDAQVSVTYLMENVSSKGVTVTFGFPVEDVVDLWKSYRVSEGAVKTDEPLYTREYQVRVNGKKIRHTYSHEPFGSGKKKNIKPFKGMEKLLGIKGWMVSKVKLKANQKFTMRITYLSQYDERFSSVSDDSTQRALSFSYRLSTGAVWHGPIKKGVVTITPTSQVSAKMVRVNKPVNRFKMENQKFVWRFKDLEPTLADDIFVEAIPGRSYYAFYDGEDHDEEKCYIQIGGKWYLENRDYAVKASSALADQEGISYGAENLKHVLQRAWSEGVKGHGLGESILLTLKKPMKVEKLAVINGYNKNRKLFHLNSRVKNLEITINGKIKKELELADNSHEMFYDLGYQKPIRSLKLTIKSVYEGQKYQDTCLSSISLLERLAKEPKNYGAR